MKTTPGFFIYIYTKYIVFQSQAEWRDWRDHVLCRNKDDFTLPQCCSCNGFHTQSALSVRPVLSRHGVTEGVCPSTEQRLSGLSLPPTAFGFKRAAGTQNGYIRINKSSTKMIQQLIECRFNLKVAHMLLQSLWSHRLKNPCSNYCKLKMLT